MAKIGIRGLVYVLAASVVLCGGVQAQDWSPAQQAVWANVQAYWDLDGKGDLEGFLAYFHEDYSGWSFDDPVPTGKASARKWLGYGYESGQTLEQEIMPLAIRIHGDVAIVQYYFVRAVQDSDGKRRRETGNWTDVLLRQGDKWVLIADRGGVAPDED